MPCADETVEFESAAKKLKESGALAFQIVEGAVSDPPSGGAQRILASAEQLGQFGIQVLPATVAIAPDGRIAAIQEGFLSADEMTALAERARTLPPISRVADAGYVFSNQPGVVAPIPVYKPPVDRAAWVQGGKKSGDVALSVIVAKDGSVMKVNVMKSPNSDLTDLAVEAVRRWTFKPGSRDGQSVNVAVPIMIRF
jgi:TonB family protein